MPQDPNLYGQRPSKRQKKEIPLSSSLDFASQLTSLLSTSASGPASASSSAVSAGRARPSKNKDDVFSVRAKRKPGSAAATTNADSKDGGRSGGRDKDSAKLSLKEIRGTEDEKQDLVRARRKMEEKARLYAAMKRGDYIAKEGESAPLVDFDRKWAEKHPDDDPNGANNSSSGTDDSEDDSDDGGKDELIEYKDEFGRTRRGTRAEIARLQRQRKRIELGAAELEAMAAKPTKAPANLIFGDVIQSAAFNPEDDTYAKMESLAARRDKEPTPPPDTHFDGGAEIRTKGVGFYQFSRDEGARKTEMEGLGRERENTEHVRREREEAREKRRREIEERRARIGAKRAEKMAESFLDGLAEKWGAAGGDVGGSGSGGKDKEVGDGGKGKGVADEKSSS
ncbi:uncharacterized protein GGS22DRAFT_91681 [Annulohypoxylon maeteangense]|uniref:uncharacterized protein n=1 Tax=Annulohypoxylon maeteangense TaxID=1927788 RepID=UPI002008AD95|nr:uncharacterized protein GGS22DRAFT_91681 [Annulohypoxylon maeteangense]KAI0887984.1 hypothetical protein GGS22DRAFT_91681 [Annulohypoxylon maeteangense]